MTPCERCKNSQASCYVTDIDANGKRVERRLCESCAVQEGWMQPVKVVDEKQLLEEFIEQSGSADVAKGLNQTCDECGMTFVEFRNHGLLGCANDYEVFAEPLMRLLERAHDGATRHAGKAPRSLDQPRVSQQDLRRLQRQIADAVADEDYERAAALRDRLRRLEEK